MKEALYLMLSLIYGVWVIWQTIIWKKIARQKTVASNHQEELTILVVARNECFGLMTLVKSLEAQNYPFDKITLLVLNDASTDGTKTFITNYSGSLQIQLISGDFKGVSPKRNALMMGIAHSKTDLILCTDADCRVGPYWVSTMVAALQQADFVSAPVVMEGAGWWAKMQQLEFASLVGSGMTLLHSGLPLMCNGANMAFRRSVFLSNGGFQGFPEVASGDDVFILQRFFYTKPNRVLALADTRVTVQTQACPDWPSFYKQRLRWAGKWSQSLYPQTIPVATLVFALNLFYFISPFLCLMDLVSIEVFLASWLVRGLSEALFLSNILRKLGKSFKFDIFLLVFLLYAPYVVMFGALAALGVKTTWKNRAV